MDNNTSFNLLIVPIKSPDIDCDGVVDEADEAIMTASMGTADFRCDLNCDGVVDNSDYSILQKHMYHGCAEVIGIERSSWGRIKAFYNK